MSKPVSRRRNESSHEDALSLCDGTAIAANMRPFMPEYLVHGEFEEGEELWIKEMGIWGPWEWKKIGTNLLNFI